MANPNILNSTSVKYFNYTQILEKERFTISTSATSDYQTKNIVLRNDVNSGKILKINRISFSNQGISNRSSDERELYLTYITDYTDSTIADTTLAPFGSTDYTPIYGKTRLDVIRGGVEIFFLQNNPLIVSTQVFPTTSTNNLFYGMDSFYLMEGNAFECYADAPGRNSLDLTYAEFYCGRARIHIDYEEYTG